MVRTRPADKCVVCPPYIFRLLHALEPVRHCISLKVVHLSGVPLEKVPNLFLYETSAPLCFVLYDCISYKSIKSQAASQCSAQINKNSCRMRTTVRFFIIFYTFFINVFHFLLAVHSTFKHLRLPCREENLKTGYLWRIFGLGSWECWTWTRWA